VLNDDDRIAHERGVAFLRAATAGMRVVIRHRLDDGSATDALGWLHVADTEHVVVATHRGLETVALSRVVAAKEVPPPPAPRERIRPV
jgi:hypothetical protein